MTYEEQQDYKGTMRNLATLEPKFAARKEDAIRYIRAHIHMNIGDAVKTSNREFAVANLCIAIELFNNYLKKYKEEAEEDRGVIDLKFYTYYIKNSIAVASNTSIANAVAMHYGGLGLAAYHTLVAIGYDVMSLEFWIEFEQMINATKPAVESIELPELEMSL